MPRVTLNAQPIGRSGLNPAFVAAEVDGNAFRNSGREFIHVKNGDTVSHTVTVLIQQQVDSQDVTDRQISIGPSEERMIGPFPRRIYNTGGDDVWFDYDAVASVTVAVFRL